MAQSICDCHCGTRIDLDEQLLQQREMWKQKYMCLQKQFKVDIQMLKQNIYAQCAGIMQQQFSQKEIQHTKTINQKNIQIKDLITRTLNLQTRLKVTEKQKQILESKLNSIASEIDQKNSIINELKSKGSKSIRDWELKHEQQLINLRQKFALQAKQNNDKSDVQKQALKQKIKQFQQKYQKIIPEIQKMKCALNTKTAQNQQLLVSIQKQKKQNEENVQTLNKKIQDLNKIHNTCSKQIRDLSQNNESLSKQLDRSRNISRQVRVQPVYIDRPVQVQKVTQKIVQVQKIVNKFVDNPNMNKKTKILQDENSKLKDQLNNLLKQLKQIEQHAGKTSQDYQSALKQQQKNISLYKKQRENLALRITEQNKQLQLMHSLIQKLGGERASRSQTGENQRIIVHVKQDGTYQKTVQKLPNVATVGQKKKK